MKCSLMRSHDPVISKMADREEPPPLFGDEEDGEESERIDNEPEDLFISASEPSKSPVTKDEEDDMEDIFAEAQADVPLDSPEEKDPLFKESVKEPEPAPHQGLFDAPPPNRNTASTRGMFEDDDDEDDDVIPDPEPPKPARYSPATVKAETTASTVTPSALAATANTNSDQMVHFKSEEELAEEQSGDQYSIEITITEPKKMGDGMNAYMAYKVNTKTTYPEFQRCESAVYRRFSDFLGLHTKLVEEHQCDGIIIPPPPEKSVLGMTKIKMSKEEAGSADFVEKRRAALERFLNRTGKHAILRKDQTFIDFLTKEGDLPKSSSTSALSGAGMMRLFNKVGDSLGKMTFKMDEGDQWFEEKQQQIDSMEHQLRKLHTSIEALVQHRKELAVNTGTFAKSAAMLGTAEEHTALSRALSQLAEVEEKVDILHLDQADSDFFVLAELVKDYISLVGAIKEVFSERVKIFRTWKEYENTLNKKREARAKLELQRKLDKIPAVSQEITALEDKVEKGQEEFEKISKNIRKEMVRFDKQRVKDFKATIIHYLESLMNSQQQLIKYWDTFLPEAKAIA